MHLYNVKLIEYPNGTKSVRYYKNPIFFDRIDEVEKEKMRDEREREKMNRVVQTPWGVGYLVDNFESDLSDEEIEKKALRSLIVSMNRSVNKIYDIARCANWQYFVTLTFDDTKIDTFSYRDCRSTVSNWLKYVKKKYASDLQYLFVPELHPTSGRFHFHGLLSNVSNLKFIVAKNQKKFLDDGSPNFYYGDDLRVSYPNGKFIYNLANYKSGYSTAIELDDSRAIANYITKYITKDLCCITKNLSRYIASKNLDSPKRFCFLCEKNDFLLGLQNMLESDVKEVNYSKTVSINVNDYENVVTYYEIN